ncbi:MAG: DNA-3-methyladenine glycosylase 2 family protein [Magnetovibrio sp.]|nr:DNA-3-methyladenine glycosylase 2 family protein [Magnetovibrio sp.]
MSREAARLRRQVRALAKTCPHMAEALEIGGMPPPRDRAGGFATLLRIIVDQQISTHAGAAIWRRLEDRLGHVTPDRVMAVRPATLQKCGLSKSKMTYARNLAGAIRSGDLDMDGLEEMSDADVAKALIAIKGIGTWTAEIYLMFALGRPDVMPAGDLALQVAAGRLMGLAERPTAKQLGEIAERWRPRRTAAAIMLWQYYRRAPLAD